MRDFDESTRKVVALSVLAGFVALMVALTLWINAAQHTTTQKLKARADACHIRNAEPRDIGVCIRIGSA